MNYPLYVNFVNYSAVLANRTTRNFRWLNWIISSTNHRNSILSKIAIITTSKVSRSMGESLRLFFRRRHNAICRQRRNFLLWLRSRNDWIFTVKTDIEHLQLIDRSFSTLRSIFGNLISWDWLIIRQCWWRWIFEPYKACYYISQGSFVSLDL